VKDGQFATALDTLEAQVRDIARSIEQQGLLQPIGLKQLPEEDTYLLVYGAHRLAAMLALDRDAIPAYVLPDDWTEADCLLAELQENSARNDVTGAQRKAYAAEIGRLLSDMAKYSDVPNRNISWLLEIGKTSGYPQSTLYDWWHAFCQVAGLSITPRQALDHHKPRFYDWLDAQQRDAEAEKARRAHATEKAQRDRLLEP
jgi:hypothetical protein